MLKVHPCCSRCRNFILRLNNIPLYVYAAFCICMHPLMDTWCASTLWMLWLMLLWTWMYKYLFTISSPCCPSDCKHKAILWSEVGVFTELFIQICVQANVNSDSGSRLWYHDMARHQIVETSEGVQKCQKRNKRLIHQWLIIPKLSASAWLWSNCTSGIL